MTFSAPRDAAEAALLASVMLTDKALDILTDERVQPQHFRRPQDQALYGGMLALRDAGSAVDEVTLKARFDSPQSPVTAADIEMLVYGGVPNLGHLRDYCRIVREHHWFDEAQIAVYEAQDGIERRDTEAVSAAFATFDQDAGEPDKPASTQDEFLEWYEDDRHSWPLPFAQLTDSTGGLVPGEPTVIGGWSGMGKSFLLAQILRTCRKAGANVHEYANEMHGPARTARTLTAMTGIPVDLITKRKLDKTQWAEVMNALKHLPYETTATAGWPVERYCRDIRRRKWDVAAIDTVTNLPCSRVDEWDRACVMLADAAAQAGTHLILVSQLNLERDKGKKPPPVGRDLRNTGAWFQRARVVMFLHRDQESIDAGDGQEIWREKPEGHVRVDKATHGDPSVGFVPVRFDPRFLRFLEVDGRHLELAS